jgi:tetratricopeptide (TPR) repeat protein
MTNTEGFLAAHDADLETGDSDQAHRSLRNALRRAPATPGAQARRARLLNRMGAPGALAAIGNAIEQREATAANCQFRARVLLREGKASQALLAASEATRLAPDSADARRLLAESNLSAGHIAAAAAARSAHWSRNNIVTGSCFLKR